MEKDEDVTFEECRRTWKDAKKARQIRALDGIQCM